MLIPLSSSSYSDLRGTLKAKAIPSLSYRNHRLKSDLNTMSLHFSSQATRGAQVAAAFRKAVPSAARWSKRRPARKMRGQKFMAALEWEEAFYEVEKALLQINMSTASNCIQKCEMRGKVGADINSVFLSFIWVAK